MKRIVIAFMAICTCTMLLVGCGKDSKNGMESASSEYSATQEMLSE